MIRYGQQEINDDDISAILKVLDSTNLTQGPFVRQFEKDICSYTTAEFGVAVNSATSALHIACLALGVGPGDYVWTSPNSFVASANCALYCGAKIDFVDVDAKTYNMCADALEQKLIRASTSGNLPKVVIPVHFAGQSCDMARINSLSKHYGFKVLEDASHAIGGYYRDVKVGACQYSDITVFSFHPVKIITTGEGGIALTNDKDLAVRLDTLRSHGITREPSLMENASHGPWYYEQIDLGFNYRLTDIQAALGSSQLRRIDDFVARRHSIKEFYELNLVDFPVTLPNQLSDTYSSLHLYPIMLNLDDLTVTHREVFDFLRSKEVLVNLHYIPIHMQPFYRKLGFSPGDFPQAESYYARAISIPMHPSLTEDELYFVTRVLKQGLGI